MAPPPASARRAVLVTAGGLARALLGLLCLVLIATLVPPLLGYQRFVVVGGSMEPTIHRGSVIFDEIVPVEDLRPGDVITYVPPGHTTPSTHRIISRELDPEGSWRSAPRATPTRRPTRSRSCSSARSRRAWRSRSRTSASCSWPSGPTPPAMALFVAPAILIALWMLGGVWRDAGRLVQQERA